MYSMYSVYCVFCTRCTHLLCVSFLVLLDQHIDVRSK
jgi:hypothetical protein